LVNELVRVNDGKNEAPNVYEQTKDSYQSCEISIHRKMIEMRSVHVPMVLLKWKTLPPKHGT